MGGMYDDNFYFQNPVDYMANLTDPWFLEQLSTCEIRLVTGSGPYEKSGYSYAMSGHSRAEGDPPFARRLGTARRPRLAVLEGAAARIHFALVSAGARLSATVRLPGRTCRAGTVPSAITCSSSIHTSQCAREHVDVRA